MFTSVIEAGIATAGFSGIAAALGRRAHGAWSIGELARISVLLQTSFAAILFSFLPLVLHGAGVAETLIWRTGSGCYVLYMSVALPFWIRGALKVPDAEASVSLGFFKTVFPLLVAFTAFQFYNALFLHAGWAFALAVIFELVMALLMLVRLIRTLWTQSDD